MHQKNQETSNIGHNFHQKEEISEKWDMRYKPANEN